MFGKVTGEDIIRRNGTVDEGHCTFEKKEFGFSGGGGERKTKEILWGPCGTSFALFHEMG